MEKQNQCKERMQKIKIYVKEGGKQQCLNRTGKVRQNTGTAWLEKTIFNLFKYQNTLVQTIKIIIQSIFNLDFDKQIKLKFIMNTQPKRKLTKNQIIDASGSRLKVTRLEQQIDDAHVVVESTKPISQTSTNHHLNSDRAKYHIQIDDEDDDNIDVIVNFGRSPMIKSNRRYDNKSNFHQNNHNTNQSNSRIIIESSDPDNYDYLVRYSTQNNPEILTHNRSHQHQKSNNSYQTVITQTSHIIKIKGGSRQQVPYHHQHLGDRDASSRYDQRYSQSQILRNFGQQYRRQRVEKDFGVIGNKNMEGKIMKNGESNKNIQQSSKNELQYGLSTPEKQKNQNQLQNGQKTSKGKPNSNENMTKIELIEKQKYQEKQKQKQKQEARQSLDLQKQRIKRINQQAHKNVQNKETSSYGEAISKKQYQSTNFEKGWQSTGFNNSNLQQRNGIAKREQQGSMSPIVHDYNNTSEINQPQSPYLIDEAYDKFSRPKIFNRKDDKSTVVSEFKTYVTKEEQEWDKQRVAPVPYKRKTLEMNIQDEIQNEWTPSLKDIPYGGGIVKKNYQSYKQNGKRDVIVVPVQKIPKMPENNRYKTEISIQNGSNGGHQVKKVQVSLNSSAYQQKLKRRNMASTQQDDLFVLNKQRYLERLRRQERSRSRIQDGRTLTHRSRHSLSPECEKITNRLHTTRINKQPCPKYVEYQRLMKRNQMKETLGQYTFIRRYLTDGEIEEILNQLERLGVPERKWSMKLVDIVYDKLKGIKLH